MHMLRPFPLPLSRLQNQSRSGSRQHNYKGFILKLLPDAKKINRQPIVLPINLSQKVLSSFETEFYELRESFSKVDSKYGIDPAARDNHAIQVSASGEYLHVVKYLMEEVESTFGIDPAAGDNDAIRCAAQEGHLDVVKYLMEEVESTYGIDPAAGDNEAINCAFNVGHFEVVKYFKGLDTKFGIEID